MADFHSAYIPGTLAESRIWPHLAAHDQSNPGRISRSAAEWPGLGGRPQQDSNLRTRLRRPSLRSSEFVRSACLYSIAGPSDGQDHSAYIPDHGCSRPADLPFFRCSGCPAQAGCTRVHGCLRLRQGADDCGRCRHGCRRRYHRTSRLAGGESNQGWTLFSVAPAAVLVSAWSSPGRPGTLTTVIWHTAQQPHGLLPREEDQRSSSHLLRTTFCAPGSSTGCVPGAT
jgi:hypothetical protein